MSEEKDLTMKRELKKIKKKTTDARSVCGVARLYPTLGRWKQASQEFKVILGYVVSLRLGWTIVNCVSKQTNRKNPAM